MGNPDDQYAMFGSRMTNQPDVLDIKHEAVARSLQFLQTRWNEPIKVSDLVEVASMSRRGFIKAFVRHTGSKPKLELSRLRLAHARRLLEQTDLPLAMIAPRCGYQSANSLLVAFKRENNLTPSQYRSRPHCSDVPNDGTTANTLPGHLMAG